MILQKIYIDIHMTWDISMIVVEFKFCNKIYFLFFTRNFEILKFNFNYY